MISDTDKDTIIALAGQYDVGEMLLFGSSADPQKQSSDIDLAVEGIAPEEFFTFYGDLFFHLSRPVDLIDLRNDTKFNSLIRREGIRLYGRTA